jgi:hypothetical protein
MFHRPILESAATAEISLPELIGAYSYALDAGQGRPAGHSVRSCWIGMQVGRAMGLSTQGASDLYLTLLLANAPKAPESLPSVVFAAVGAVREHWDGTGHPDGLAGEAIPLPARISLLAQLVDITHAESGRYGAVQEVSRRSKTWLDPKVASAFRDVSVSDFFWDQLTGPFLDARVAMLAPVSMSWPSGDHLLRSVAADLGRVINHQALDGDCIAALRRAGIVAV